MLNLERINDYLTSDEASQLLGCSKRTLRRYSSQGLVSKVGVGKATRYSLESVIYLKNAKGTTKFDKILSQLSGIASTQQLILTRLSLIESIFFSGAKVELSKDEINDLRLAIKEASILDTIPFSVCEDWSKDLLRIPKSSLLSIGESRLNSFLDRLIINAETQLNSGITPQKRLVVDRLRWIKSFVG